MPTRLSLARKRRQADARWYAEQRATEDRQAQRIYAGRPEAIALMMEDWTRCTHGSSVKMGQPWNCAPLTYRRFGMEGRAYDHRRGEAPLRLERKVGATLTRSRENHPHGVYGEEGWLLYEVGCCSWETHTDRLISNALYRWQIGFEPFSDQHKEQAEQIAWDTLYEAGATYDPSQGAFWPYARSAIENAWTEFSDRLAKTDYEVPSEGDDNPPEESEHGLSLKQRLRAAAYGDPGLQDRWQAPEAWREAWNTLRPEERATLMLRRVKGLTIKETAAKLGISTSSVTYRQRTATKKLHDLLGYVPKEVAKPEPPPGPAHPTKRIKVPSVGGGSQTYLCTWATPVVTSQGEPWTPEEIEAARKRINAWGDDRFV